MRIRILSYVGLFLFAIVVVRLIMPSVAYLNTSTIPVHLPLPLRSAPQSSNLKILGPDKKPNPVVNENNQINLTVTDANGQPVTTDVTFESGSSDIASVDPATGVVRGVQRGFATITARRGSDSVSAFVVVTRLSTGNGAKVPGDTKTDTAGRIYISDPLGSVILRKDGFAGSANLFAGQKGTNGKTDGQRLQAQFNAPTAVAVDNSPLGGVYIADTANHSIRKIDFNDQVTTVLGTGAPGVNTNDVTPFGQVVFRGLRGIATDTGGNLYIADTENHAIYLADFAKKEVRLLAGEPGMSGKADGRGRAARFNRPTGIALSSDGRTIAVADTGNNAVRLITRDGDVTTLGVASSANGVATSKMRALDQAADGIVFDAPQSVSFDATGNIYVVDNSGVQLATHAVGQMPQIVSQVVSLAQPGTFGKAASVVVQGADALVLDAGAASDDAVVKDVTVGAPEITSLSQIGGRLEGMTEVIITGKNFAPESLVVLGDRVVADAAVESATQIRLRVPQQNAPGNRTLSVITRGGVAQTEFAIVAKTLSELVDGEVTTIAGGVPFIGDSGKAIKASLNRPCTVAIDGSGNLFIADLFNNRVRRIDASGIITTAAGNGTASFTGDGGPAISAGLNGPVGVAVDLFGNLFIADAGNDRIRRVDSTTGIISTVAGNGARGFSGDGGPAVNAGLNLSLDPIFYGGLALDSAGDLFIADFFNNSIRRVDAATGIITTVVGNGKAGFNGDGGPATKANLSSPSGIAFDAVGNLFISDTFNLRIRRVDAGTGTITTVAGNGDLNPLRFGDGGLASNANFGPLGVALDSTGNLFIADNFHNRIRRVDAKTNIVTTVAGNGNFVFGGDDGPAISAGLRPQGIAVDGPGNLLIPDTINNRIRRVDESTGIITTAAGSDVPIGDGGPATSAILSNPYGVSLDNADNLFIADQQNLRIRRVGADRGIISTVAGNGTLGSFSEDNGPAINAGLDRPSGVYIDRAGNIFIADTFKRVIRRVDANTGIITRVAGSGSIADSFGGDGGPALAALLDNPRGVAVDISGNLFIVDTVNDRIRRVDESTGIITTVVGNGKSGFSGDGGPAANASLRLHDELDLRFIAGGLAIDGAGNLFIADTFNNRVRLVNASTGIITTVAGNGSAGFSGDGGPATAASLFGPIGVALDQSGNILIADSANNRIRKVDAQTGIITTVAGNGTIGYSGDGGPATIASLSFPKDVAVDRAGNLLIADSANSAIRIVKRFANSRPAADFALTVSPASQTVSAGASTSFTVGIGAVNSFAELVDLSAALSPPSSDVTVNFSPSTLLAGAKATMTVSTTASTVPSTFNIAVTGKSGQLVHTQTVTLVVTGSGGGGDFALAINPTSQTVSAGASVSFTVGVQAMGGFSQPVALSASSSESSLTTSFSPGTVNPGGNATLTVNTKATTPANTYTITVTGTAGQIVRTKTVTLSVMAGDFALTVSPDTQMIVQGGSTNFVVSVQATGSFTQAVSLSADAAPSSSSITISFSSSSIIPGSNSTLTINTGVATPPGTFTLTVTGTAGQLVRTKSVTLTVVAGPDFALLFNPATLTVARGQKGQFAVNINRTGGFAGNVTVTAPDTRAIKIKLTPPRQSTTGTSVSFNFKIKASAPIGTQQLTFTGQDDSGRLRTGTLTLVIQ